MKFNPYSFSKINTFFHCNRKFKYQYIDKVPGEDFDKTPFFKGGALHAIIQSFPNKSDHKFAEKFQYLFDKFLKSKLGQKYLFNKIVNEYKFALDENLNPCEYSNKALIRGFIDGILIKDNLVHILDWKSGRLKDLKYQNFDQLMFYAIYLFQKYPIDKIKISYVYIEHDLENDLILERKYLNNYIKDLLKKIITIEKETEFKKMPNKFCYNCKFKNHCNNDI